MFDAGLDRMIDLASTIRWPPTRSRTCHVLESRRMCFGLRGLFGGGRKCSVPKTIYITVIGISLVLITEDILRPAPSDSRVLFREAGVPSGDSSDRLFGRLEALLRTVDPRPRCRQKAVLGGRGFSCEEKEGAVLGAVDGFKPICLDWLRPNCSVFSFGINHDFTFDDAMEDLGCTVHAFDPTMGVGSFRRSNSIHFHSIGIGAEDNQLGGFPVASFATIVRQAGLGSGIIDYVKLDVESSEWEVLERQLAVSGDLLRVKQLAIEFHLWRWSPALSDGVGFGRGGGKMAISSENAKRFVDVLEALKTAGFALTDTINSVSCQSYNNGCLSLIYETVWVNTKIKS